MSDVDHAPRETGLLADLVAAFPEVERFVLDFAGDDHVQIFAFLSDKASLKECWTEKLVSCCIDKGIIAYPSVFTPKQWRHMERTIPPEQWPRLVVAGESQEAVIDLVTLQSGTPPRRLRRLLLREIRSARRLIETLRNAPAIGFHARLSGATAVYGRTLKLFFATRGQRFTPTPEAVAYFDEELTQATGLSRADLLVYFEALAACEQAKLCQQLGTSRDLRRSSIRLMDRMLDFLKRFRRHVVQSLSTPRDRIVRKAVIAAAITAAVGLALTVVGLHFYSHRTFVPIADESVITRPGAIGIRYYKGLKLNKLVDRGVGKLSFRRRQPINKNVPANNFSFLARGYLLFPDNGTFYICSRHDDGAKIYLGDRLIIDDFIVGGARTRCRRVTVQKGWHRLSVAFFDAAGWAELRLKVGRNEKRVKAVPPNRLCCQ